MTQRSNFGIASLLLLGVLSACGGDSTAPPTTGTLEINVVTTGADIDADGFVLTLDGRSPQNISANGKVSIAEPPGTHTITISGYTFNCDVPAPLAADVSLGTTTRVDVVATCTPYLRNVIAYVSEEFGFPEVMVMRPDGSRNERLTTDQAVYADPAVSPDGQAIAVASRIGGSWHAIYLLDRFGKGRTTLVDNNTLGAGGPVWSPDGTKIAFVYERPGPSGAYGRIFIVNKDGTGLRQVTPEVSANIYIYDSAPSWSPDGTRLVFSRMGDLSLINVDGTGLVSTGQVGNWPHWSPDGTQIAYEKGTAGSDGIFAMDMTFTPHRVTTAVQQDETPHWSPDGSHIVFARLENNIFHIYKMAADGSNMTKLSTVAGHEYYPSWTRSF